MNKRNMCGSPYPVYSSLRGRKRYDHEAYACKQRKAGQCKYYESSADMAQCLYLKYDGWLLPGECVCVARRYEM